MLGTELQAAWPHFFSGSCPVSLLHSPFRIKATVLLTALGTFKTRFCFWLPLLCHLPLVLAATPGHFYFVVCAFPSDAGMTSSQACPWDCTSSCCIFSTDYDSKTDLLFGFVCCSPPRNLSPTGCVPLHTGSDRQVCVQ